MTLDSTTQIELNFTDEEAASIEEASRIAGIGTEELIQVAFEKLLETARAASV
jgi:hypothetical protein